MSATQNRAPRAQRAAGASHRRSRQKTRFLAAEENPGSARHYPWQGQCRANQLMIVARRPARNALETNCLFQATALRELAHVAAIQSLPRSGTGRHRGNRFLTTPLQLRLAHHQVTAAIVEIDADTVTRLYPGEPATGGTLR